jgi:hypothetical protein
VSKRVRAVTVEKSVLIDSACRIARLQLLFVARYQTIV